MDRLWGGRDDGRVQGVFHTYKERMESFEISKAVECVVELVTEVRFLSASLCLLSRLNAGAALFRLTGCSRNSNHG